MSLADELLADLEEEGNDDLVEALKNEVEHDAEDEMQFDEQNPVEAMEIDVRVKSVRELCTLRDSKTLTYILKEIEVYAKNPRNSSEMVGNVESDPEYQLIVEANNITVDIDNEISK